MLPVYSPRMRRGEDPPSWGTHSASKSPSPDFCAVPSAQRRNRGRGLSFVHPLPREHAVNVILSLGYTEAHPLQGWNGGRWGAHAGAPLQRTILGRWDLQSQRPVTFVRRPIRDSTCIMDAVRGAGLRCRREQTLVCDLGRDKSATKECTIRQCYN